MPSPQHRFDHRAADLAVVDIGAVDVLRFEDHHVIGGKLLARYGVDMRQAVVIAVVTPVVGVILPARILVGIPVVDKNILRRRAARAGYF